MSTELVKSFADLLGEASGIASDGTTTAVDIITFVESAWGLGMGTQPGVPALLPAQKFILKAFYGVPLDSVEKRIPIHDQFNEQLLYLFTEVEFLDYLYEEGRINTKDLSGNRSKLALVCGRRGTKTTVTSVIASYELYRMLLQYHPQGYFGIMPDEVIYMTCLSTTLDNAQILYDRTVGSLERSPFFKDFMLKEPNKTEVFLRSTRDQKEFDKKHYSIKFWADACDAKGLRGPSNIFVAFDEVAHFFKELKGKTGSGKSDYAVYDAIHPSLAAFKYPDTGLPAGKELFLSSPADKSGLFWDEYERAFDTERGQNILMVQLPSWEMNPTIPTSFLKDEYSKSVLTYSTEYGANFSDRVSGWLEDASILRRCLDDDLRMVERSSLRIPYFLGGDLGLKKDGTALAVVHLEDPGVGEGAIPIIVVDWVGARYASLEKTLQNGEEPYFRPEEMVDWIAEISGKFNIHKGLFDQHYEMSVMPLLKTKGLTQITCKHFNDSLNSDIYQNFMAKMISKGLKMPTTGKTDTKGNPVDHEYVTELLKLQAVRKSKYQIKVFMPDSANGHDDLSDALARAIWLACQHIQEGGYGSASSQNKGTSHPGRAAARMAQHMDRLMTKRPTGGMIYKSSPFRYRGR